MDNCPFSHMPASLGTCLTGVPSFLNPQNQKSFFKPLHQNQYPSPPRKASIQFHFTDLSINLTYSFFFLLIYINGVGMGRSWLRRRCRGNHGPPIDPPRPRWSPERPNRRHSQPSQAIPFRRPLLHLLAHGYLLEVRDSPHLRIGLMYPI